jgi:hypothetical protein
MKLVETRPQYPAADSTARWKSEAPAGPAPVEPRAPVQHAKFVIWKVPVTAGSEGVILIPEFLH